MTRSAGLSFTAVRGVTRQPPDRAETAPATVIVAAAFAVVPINDLRVTLPFFIAFFIRLLPSGCSEQGSGEKFQDIEENL